VLAPHRPKPKNSEEKDSCDVRADIALQSQNEQSGSEHCGSDQKKSKVRVHRNLAYFSLASGLPTTNNGASSNVPLGAEAELPSLRRLLADFGEARPDHLFQRLAGIDHHKILFAEIIGQLPVDNFGRGIRNVAFA
jgi:hypothetical protein